MESRGHLRRAVVIWVVVAIVADLLIGFLLAPHMPPGRFSNTANDQTQINNILALILTPIGIGVITFFVYSLASFRQPAGPLEDGPPLKGDARMQKGWVVVTTMVVIVLAIVGGLFVLEAVSVIVQVVSFKLTGKRVFKMAPIHHHYEQLGWTEPQIVIRFWIVAVVLALAGLATLKLR